MDKKQFSEIKMVPRYHDIFAEIVNLLYVVEDEGKEPNHTANLLFFNQSLKPYIHHYSTKLSYRN